MEQKGYTFHNRTILGEISMSSLNEALIHKINADIRSNKEFTKDLYELAQRTFVKDRRFHLKRYFDQSFANRIIVGYIDALAKEDTVIFKCYHKDKLIGFTIVKRIDAALCENVLGAVDPLYHNQGVAKNLYSYMLKTLRDAERYKKYYGRISTTNVASINLHRVLGAKYSLPEDEYILRCER